MTVETIGANSLPPDLDATLPLPGDLKREGDDHIRNLKLVMKKFYADYLVNLTSVDGRLDALETFATAANALTLGGQAGSYYLNAGNLNAGTISADRLTGSYGISITGNAATATLATNATLAATATVAVTANNALAVGGVTAADVLAFRNNEATQASLATTVMSASYAKVLTAVLPGALSRDHTFLGNFVGGVSSGSGAVGTMGYFAVKVMAMPANVQVAEGGMGTADSATLAASIMLYGTLPSGTTSLEVWAKGARTNTAVSLISPSIKGRYF